VWALQIYRFLGISYLLCVCWYNSNICDPLSENPALPANIEFELETILSVQVVFQLNSETQKVHMTHM